MPTTIIHPHITTNKRIGNGKPIIKGTRISVRNIIGYWRLGYDAEEMIRAMPHLSLAQVYDALSYYFDNEEQIDKEIAEEERIIREHTS